MSRVWDSAIHAGAFDPAGVEEHDVLRARPCESHRRQAVRSLADVHLPLLTMRDRTTTASSIARKTVAQPTGRAGKGTV